MPTEQVIRCSSATRARMYSAIAVGEANRRNEPRTSRNASSTDSGSTAGVTDRKISITADDDGADLVVVGGHDGRRQGRAAAPASIGIPDRTP